MRKFYRKQLGIKLKWWEVRSLFPLWHLVNTISDLLILAGTFYKILLDYEVSCTLALPVSQSSHVHSEIASDRAAV